MLSEDFINHPEPLLSIVLIKKENAQNIYSIDNKVYSLNENFEWTSFIDSTKNDCSVETFLNLYCKPLGAISYIYN